MFLAGRSELHAEQEVSEARSRHCPRSDRCLCSRHFSHTALVPLFDEAGSQFLPARASFYWGIDFHFLIFLL